MTTEIPDAANGAVSDAPAISSGAGQIGRRPLWRGVRLVVWPRHVLVLAACALASLVWAVCEFVWPVPSVPRLDVTFAAKPASEDGTRSIDSSESTFVQVFGARKLFIPEVPVESRELSREIIQEMISRMRLTAVITQGNELVAWIDVPEAPRMQPGGRQPPAAAGATRMVQVKKGDMLGDFKVENVVSDGVELSIAGSTYRLGY